ncbi:MAG TPA: NAD-dependent epimerase/dehydratase family protein [Bacillota bacterium]|nr:NAD-dependent epimerase/dehydratase family protein [Bacillota bacterium]
MERILITGGAGFIGNAIIKKLVSKQYQITVLDNFSPQIHGENYENSFLFKGIKDLSSVIRGDVRNIKDWEKALTDHVDYIIHLAAETGTGQSMYEVNRYNDVNIMGLSNLFDILMRKKMNIKKIILSSSRAVYGEGMYLCEKHGVVVPKSRAVADMLNGDFSVKCPVCNNEVELLKTKEECTPSPISLYAFTKLAQEKMVEVMCPTLNIPYTIFRYQNVYGPGQSLENPYTGILSIFSNLLLENKPLNIFEDGEESRDFVFVDDVALATISAIGKPSTDNKCFNLGSGVQTTVLTVAEKLKQLYASSSEIKITGDFRKGDIRHNIADIEKAKALCDYNPRYAFEEGIKVFAKWVKLSYEGETKQQDKSFGKSIEEMVNSGILISGGKVG